MDKREQDLFLKAMVGSVKERLNGSAAHQDVITDNVDVAQPVTRLSIPRPVIRNEVNPTPIVNDMEPVANAVDRMSAVIERQGGLISQQGELLSQLVAILAERPQPAFSPQITVLPAAVDLAPVVNAAANRDELLSQLLQVLASAPKPEPPVVNVEIDVKELAGLIGEAVRQALAAAQPNRKKRTVTTTHDDGTKSTSMIAE